VVVASAAGLDVKNAMSSDPNVAVVEIIVSKSASMRLICSGEVEISLLIKAMRGSGNTVPYHKSNCWS
jgi:hypothetical protein